MNGILNRVSPLKFSGNSIANYCLVIHSCSWKVQLVFLTRGYLQGSASWYTLTYANRQLLVLHYTPTSPTCPPAGHMPTSWPHAHQLATCPPAGHMPTSWPHAHQLATCPPAGHMPTSHRLCWTITTYTCKTVTSELVRPAQHRTTTSLLHQTRKH